jgi:hypothetical protein
MGIGGSIFLIALGAILTFATNVTVSGLDLVVWGPRSRRVRRTDGVVEERRVYNDPPAY